MPACIDTRFKKALVDTMQLNEVNANGLPKRQEILHRLLIDRPSLRVLLLITLPATLIGMALLIAPARLYSAEMTWDLLFNLDGAWRLYNGQVPHVDFHTELGSLTFAMTALGFQFVGPNVMGVPIGECLFAALVLALCIATSSDRLPLVPAAIFTILSTYIVLMPSTYGDGLGAYSFAMAYNRFGWSISSILFVVVFIEPLNVRRSVWKDCVVGLATLLLLYYTKITYFCVGMAALALAFLVAGHVRTNRRGWFVVFAIALMNAVAPYNFDYIRDILNQALAGEARASFSEYLTKYINDPAEYAVALAGCLLLIAAPSQGRYRSQTLVAAWFLLMAGPLLLSQNSQTHGIPTYVVLCLLVYGAAHDLIMRQPRILNDFRKCCLLLAPLMFPMLLLGVSSFSLLHYCYAQVRRIDRQFVVTETNLKGLAVPVDEFLTFNSFARRGWTPSPANQVKKRRPRYELSQLEYVRTLLDLASLWRATATNLPPRILIMDRVNALPFMLGLPSPRGVNLWWGETWGYGLVKRPGDDVFADTDFVAVPRYSSMQQTTEDLLDFYSEYLTAHFGPWRETPDWVVLRRLTVADER